MITTLNITSTTFLIINHLYVAANINFLRVKPLFILVDVYALYGDHNKCPPSGKRSRCLPHKGQNADFVSASVHD